MEKENKIQSILAKCKYQGCDPELNGITITTPKAINGYQYLHNFVALGTPTASAVDPITDDIVTIDGEEYVIQGISIYEGLSNSLVIKVDYLYIPTWCQCCEWIVLPEVTTNATTQNAVEEYFTKKFKELLAKGYDKAIERVMDILMD